MYYEKFNIFTCRIILPKIDLWFYYYQLCKARLVKVWQFKMLTIVAAHIYRQLQLVNLVNYNSNKIRVFAIVIKIW